MGGGILRLRWLIWDGLFIQRYIHRKVKIESVGQHMDYGKFYTVKDPSQAIYLPNGSQWWKKTKFSFLFLFFFFVVVLVFVVAVVHNSRRAVVVAMIDQTLHPLWPQGRVERRLKQRPVLEEQIGAVWRRNCLRDDK